MTFAPRIVFGDIDLTSAPYMVEFGFNLGASVTLYDVIASLMLDGSNTTSPGAGNRENVQLSIITEWPDSFVAARNAETLELESAKPFNTLTFYPGDGHGPASVLETFEGQIVHDYDQDLEQAGLRRYILTLPALPFARSEEPVAFVWTGPGEELNALTSLTGWTASPTPTLGDTGSGPFFEMAANTTFSRSIVADNYLWIQLQGSATASAATLHDVTVNGVAVAAATVRHVGVGPGYWTIPTEAWQGQTVTVSFVVNATALSHTFLKEFWSLGYPNIGQKITGGVSRPKGLDVVDILGSARTPCTISFTAPAGGAWVYTAPDPNAALRQRGVGEMVFGVFEVTAPEGAETDVDGYLQYFPPGDHAINIGMTDPQPLELNPNGVYPQTEMTTFSATGITGAFQFPYPVDRRAAVSYFNTSGAKTLISPSPTLPQGYHGDALVYTVHSLHPGRCGVGVFDADGDPITATFTYYPRNLIHAAH